MKRYVSELFSLIFLWVIQSKQICSNQTGIKAPHGPGTHAASEPYPVLFPLKCLRRKQRCEKNPIPQSQKDEKYFEKRKRNNEAAKKSRDARKIREDRVS